MEKIMTNGFCELDEQEMMMVDGGETGSEAASKGFGYYFVWYWGNKTNVISNVGEDGDKRVVPESDYHNWARNPWGQP